MHVLLVGNGKMAKAVEIACVTKGIKLTRFGADFDYSNQSYGKPVVIHLGSGRQLLQLIELQPGSGSPYMVFSRATGARIDLTFGVSESNSFNS